MAEKNEQKSRGVAEWIYWVIAGIAVAAWITKCATEEPKPTTQKPDNRSSRPVVEEEWVISWDKYPEHKGKTPTRIKDMKSKVLIKTGNKLIFEYFFSGGSGTADLDSNDGKIFEGIWRDKTGWGKVRLRFITTTTASGWMDDEGVGPKANCSFVKIS